MTPLLLTLAMAVGAEDKPDTGLEGKWLIVYAEEGGRRNTTWEQRVATMKGDTLSYSKEGEDRSVKLALGDKQSAKATLMIGKDAEGKSLAGVCIASQDYLCLSLNASSDKKDNDNKGSSGSFILILRRQR
jgi:hypothetical protein